MGLKTNIVQFLKPTRSVRSNVIDSSVTNKNHAFFWNRPYKRGPLASGTNVLQLEQTCLQPPSVPLSPLIREYARVCQSMPEYTRICRSMQEYARVCQSMTEYTRVCQSVPEYARVLPSFAFI